MPKTYNRCRICNSKELKNFRIGNAVLIRCSRCGIVYNRNIPDESQLDNYYTEDYQITDNDILQTEKRRIFRIPEQVLLISELRNHIPTPATILDIGCDKGFFLDEARRYGYDVKGVEPSETARNYCNKIGIKTFKSIVEVQDKFEIITMWHSLEHFSDPVGILNTLKNILNESGIIAIRVPAFDSIYRKIAKDKWIWFQQQNHYYHYTAESIRNLLLQTGFDIIFIRHSKPNNRYTKKMNSLVNSFFRFSFNSKINFRKRLSRIYEDITAEELYVIARKR